MPKPLRYFLNDGGGNNPLGPVPTNRISTIDSNHQYLLLSIVRRAVRTWSRRNELKYLQLVLAPTGPGEVLLWRRDVPEEDDAVEEDDGGRDDEPVREGDSCFRQSRYDDRGPGRVGKDVDEAAVWAPYQYDERRSEFRPTRLRSDFDEGNSKCFARNGTASASVQRLGQYSSGR